METPNCYLFDVGNVILFFDFHKAAEKLAPDCELNALDGYAAVAELTPVMERGEISTEEFLSEAIARVGYRGTSGGFRRVLEDIFTPNAAMLDFIRRRKQEGCPLYMLSNTSEIHASFFEKTYDIFREFDGHIYSYEEGCMKPDRQIYQRVVDKLGVDPSGTHYIDDLAENVTAGQNFGFISYLYAGTDHASFEKQHHAATAG